MSNENTKYDILHPSRTARRHTELAVCLTWASARVQLISLIKGLDYYHLGLSDQCKV